MEERTLEWLNLNEMRILKNIIIISDRQNGDTELGSIIYTRPLTENYNFKKQQEEDEREKDPIARLLHGYPKQKNYPVDAIDEIIMDSILSVYPKSIIRNDAILFNVDLEKIKIVKNRNIIPSSIYFSPEFSKIANFYEYVGRKFRAPKVDISIYSYYRPDYLDGQIFYAYYDVTAMDSMNLLSTVNFE